MDKAYLIEGYKTILRNIYSPQEYYRRALDCLSRFKQDKLEPRQINLINDFKSLAKIIMTLGVRDSERRQFWNYLFNIIRLYPRNFAHGMTLAAMGYHFRQITAKYCK